MFDTLESFSPEESVTEEDESISFEDVSIDDFESTSEFKTVEEPNKENRDFDDYSSPMMSEVNLEDVSRVQGTLRAMRVERNKLLEEVEGLKRKNEILSRENLSCIAENDELKIELSILKKRYKDEVENYKNECKLLEEKKELVEARFQELKNEKIRQADRLRVDSAQVKRRERELENKLELITIDSQNQIQNRDKIILDLKRKIDALEFNLESGAIGQQRALEQKTKSEHKVEQAVRSLKSILLALESSDDESLVSENRKQI